MEAWNYLYDKEKENFEIHIASDLFINNDGSIYCKFIKRETDGKYTVDGKILNKNNEENGNLEIILSGESELTIENINAEIGGGEIKIRRKIQNPDKK